MQAMKASGGLTARRLTTLSRLGKQGDEIGNEASDLSGSEFSHLR